MKNLGFMFLHKEYEFGVKYDEITSFEVNYYKDEKNEKLCHLIINFRNGDKKEIRCSLGVKKRFVKAMRE